jgi:hypothetical protein
MGAFVETSSAATASPRDVGDEQQHDDYRDVEDRDALGDVLHADPADRAAYDHGGPTGGVRRPMPRFRIMTTPKWTGSMPNCLITGRKIGVRDSLSPPPGSRRSTRTSSNDRSPGVIDAGPGRVETMCYREGHGFQDGCLHRAASQAASRRISSVLIVVHPQMLDTISEIGPRQRPRGVLTPRHQSASERTDDGLAVRQLARAPHTSDALYTRRRARRPVNRRRERSDDLPAR